MLIDRQGRRWDIITPVLVRAPKGANAGASGRPVHLGPLGFAEVGLSLGRGLAAERGFYGRTAGVASIFRQPPTVAFVKSCRFQS